MDQDLLREIAQQYLVPFFSGARLEQKADKSTAREHTVSYTSPCSIAFKIDQVDLYRLVITRSQPFTRSAKEIVPDFTVVKAFVDVVKSLDGILTSKFKDDITHALPRRVVAKALAQADRELILLEGIDHLDRLGAKLYEGSPVSAALGFRHMKPSDGQVTIKDIGLEDFGSVLSNGHDTILEFDYEGGLLAQQALDDSENIPSFCPFRQNAIAAWTTKHEARIAMTLNRLGEISIFQNEKLLFVRRGGKWHFLTHEAVIQQMNVPRDPWLRRAIYETCLDSSFARTGACIGVVQISGSEKWREHVSPDDLIRSSSSTKAKALRKIINGRKYSQLDRRTRSEISAIDGATIISHRGDVLSAGAILKIGGGSTGGGRLAAAKQLSKSGLGIKVSQDGSITGYRPGQLDPAFRIM